MEYRSIPFLRVIPEPRFSGCETTPHFFILPRPGSRPEKSTKTMSYKQLASYLDNYLDSIKSSLPKYFSSADFINVAKDFFPNECAEILRQSNYRALHVWIARWYLNGHFKKIGDKKRIETVMQSKSKNTIWEK